MKDVNHHTYWADAVFKPMWIIHRGEPVRELLCIKNKGKGKTARYWTRFNGGGWIYLKQKHFDWFLTFEDCEAEIEYYKQSEIVRQFEWQIECGITALCREGGFKRSQLPPTEDIPEDIALAARQYVRNHQQLRSLK